MALTDKLRGTWAQLSLAWQFAAASGLVMVLATVVVGLWVSNRIEQVVVRNTANATALYMDSFIAPLSQDLATIQTLSPVNLAEIERLLTNTPLGRRVLAFKIWVKGAKVVASSDLSIVGQTFPPTDNLKQAWTGVVRGDFNALGDREDENEASMNIPLLEIYSPIRDKSTGGIIGIAEFYEVATQLKSDLVQARLTSWTAVALMMAAIWASLYAIVLRGSQTIDRQVVDLTEMASRNVTLRLRVQGAAGRFSALNDQALRRIGADLHDGPAQLMGFAALRLDALRKLAQGDTAAHEIDQIEAAIKDAMKEIRNISRGVSLPDIDRKPLDQVIQGLVDAHAARTGSDVALHTDLGPQDLPLAVKICVGRVVQEGLTNAWRHAAGAGQQVRVQRRGGDLTVAVQDQGPGLSTCADKPADLPDSYGLGLAGLAGRVESLGGSLTLRNRMDGVTGTELVMAIDLRGVE
ncbi:MAG: two-component sensor histidine kinase [Candidatus Saccharibacteria bacterium]|nr:two-component sensor histidine kinase [Pseudorhodobacter sp.]